MNLYQLAKFPPRRLHDTYDHVVGRGVEPEVGALLYGLIRVMKPITCLETGTYVADSAEWIGRALRDNKRGTLTTCDVNMEFVLMGQQRLAGYPVICVQSKGIDLITSYEQIDFIHIDSGRGPVRLEEVMLLNEKNVSPGGLVVWHDACEPEMFEAYEKFSQLHDWPHLILPSVVGLAVFQRPENDFAPCPDSPTTELAPTDD